MRWTGWLEANDWAGVVDWTDWSGEVGRDGWAITEQKAAPSTAIRKTHLLHMT
jgi:hypothetical protein